MTAIQYISQLPIAATTSATDIIPVTQGFSGPGTGTTRGVEAGDVVATAASVSTGNFRSNDGARINRFNDRVFIGSATANDGANPNVAQDWLTSVMNWPVYNATTASLSQNGQIALSVASRTSDLDKVFANSTETTIGIVGVAFANNPGTFPNDYFAAYGAYFEARVYPATVSTAFGAEINAVNLYGSTVGQPTPYQALRLSQTDALRLASGGGQGLSPLDAGTAITITDNQAKFTAGIVFVKTSLTGADGTTGFGVAMALGKGHRIVWYYDDGGSGQEAAYITSTATQPVVNVQFQNNATLFITPAGKVSFSVSNVASSVNGIGVIPSITGAAPTLETFGDNTNVDLIVRPKGTGNLNLYAEYMYFYSDGGNQLAFVNTAVATPSNINGLIFADAGPFFYGLGGTIASFTQVASPVSSLSFSNAAAGNPVSIAAQGAGDIDILLDPAGTNGTLRLALPSTTTATAGGASALPGVPAGYFTVKDAGGTSRKIPYWNT